MKNFIKISFIITLFFIFSKTIVLGYPGEILLSFETPGKFATGLTFGDDKLWIADRYTKKIYSINPTNGKIVNEFEAQSRAAQILDPAHFRRKMV